MIYGLAPSRSDWRTPRYITDALGFFDLDPCADRRAPCCHAKEGYTVGGLSREWYGRVWLNPPYGDKARVWVERLAKHGNGVALIPPRAGSNWFHDVVFDRADAVLFLRGRIAFIHPETQQPMKGNNSDSCLVAYGENNAHALRDCSLAGALWEI
jgi:phage N-6-adenine-methyltransferase